MVDNQLLVSEMFKSIQGEGMTMGIPSIFLRLQNCNLLCNWKQKEINHFCDTVEVWKKGKPYLFNEIIDNWKNLGWIDTLFLHNGHLVITGGEPMLQQKQIVNFCQQLRNMTTRKVFIEMETNATIKPTLELYSMIDLFNTSPKLSNSNTNIKIRYNEEVLLWHTNNFGSFSKSIFKFVVNNEEDLEEINSSFINKLGISCNRVYLMPEGQTREELEEKRKWVAEKCKEFGYNYSDRLHIVIWNKKTGV